MASLASLLALALVGQSLAKAPYGLPGNTCFPSTEELSRFNSSIDGKLLAPPPYGRVCYAGQFEAPACAELVANKRNGTYREAIPAAMMYTNTGFTSSDTGCPVPAVAPEMGLDGPCELGALGSFFVQVTHADDVSRATGHDYTGRSTDAGSFVILTRAFQDIELKPDFIPAGCSASASQKVLCLGAGVAAQDLYAEAAKLGLIITGGFCPTVGIAGVVALGGGAAGPFQPVIGMGADNVVQYDIVTVDGTITVANECENRDLFWAMRGGGGVFAVNTATYVKAHPTFEAVKVVVGQVSAAHEKAYRNLISEFLRHDPHYAPSFSSGIWETTYPNLTIAFQKGFQPDETLVSGEKSLNAFDFLNSIDDVTVNPQGLQFESWNRAFESVVGPIMEEGSAVGINILDISRVVPNDLLGSEDGRQSIADFVAGLPQTQPFIFQRVGGGAVNKPAANATSVNPAFRDSAAYVDIPVFASSTGGMTSLQRSTAQSLMSQADQMFGRDAYYNEGNRLDSDYQARFWGSNYQALLSLKEKMDPNCVLTGALTVGETEICGGR